MRSIQSRKLTEDDSKFGHFVFSALHGTKGRWTEISKGVYDYTPNGNILEIDEFTVDYLDTTNNVVTKCWGKIRLKEVEDKFKYERYDVKKSFPNVTEAFKYVQGIEPNVSTIVYGLTSPSVSKSFVSVTHGHLIPSESRQFLFSCKADDHAAIYLSTSPLSGSPDKDKEFLILQRDAKQSDPNKAPKSEPITLVKEKKYYLNFVVYNKNGPGSGSMMICKPTDAKLSDFYKGWFRYKVFDQTTIDKYEYKPDLIGIPDLTKWISEEEIMVDPADWKVIEKPKGSIFLNTHVMYGDICYNCDVSKILFDYDEESEFRVDWQPIDYAIKFPHNFVIDLAKTTRFSFVKITGANNYRWFKMNSSIEFRTADNLDDLNDSKSTVFVGRYVSTGDKFLRFGKTVYGRYMKIIVHDNTFTWVDGLPGGTDFAEIEVGERSVYTNHVMVPKGCKWRIEK